MRLSHQIPKRTAPSEFSLCQPGFGFIHEQVLATDSCKRNEQSPFSAIEFMGTSLASLSLRAESLILTVLAISFTCSVFLVYFFLSKMRQLRSRHRYQTAQVETFLNRKTHKFLPASSGRRRVLSAKILGFDLRRMTTFQKQTYPHICCIWAFKEQVFGILASGLAEDAS